MILTPQNTALVIVDMQNAFLELGAPIEVPNAKRIIPHIKELIDHFRTKGIEIIWTKVNIDSFRNTQYQELFPTHFTDSSSVLGIGSNNHEITNELLSYIKPNDVIIEKDRYSAFIDTKLHSILRSKNISNLIFCGVSTNVCVESTLRDAFQLNYYCFLLKDATATFSDELQMYSESVISYVFGRVLTTTEIINSFK